jgi:aspartate-semialdehyde dehydrogenase
MLASMRGTRLTIQKPANQSPRVRANMVVRAAKTADGPKVAIVGVTGAVGQEFLRVSTLASGHCIRVIAYLNHFLLLMPQVLKERNFPYSDMKMLASAR